LHKEMAAWSQGMCIYLKSEASVSGAYNQGSKSILLSHQGFRIAPPHLPLFLAISLPLYEYVYIVKI